MGDLKIIETGDGGDAVLLGNDLEIINGFQNMPYIGAFGGNVKASTKQDERKIDEQTFDWWGNILLMPDNISTQFNSLLEKKLKEITLSSSGRIDIVNTMNEDLSFMKEFSEISISASLVKVDRIEIKIVILEPDNLESNEFTYIWDSTRSELTIN